MKMLSLLLSQVRYENRAFWRNPVSAFFTVAFPLMFLVIFNVLFGNEELETAQGTTSTSTFYVAGIVAMSLVGARYTNIAIGVSFARDQGLLKRIRGTPLPGPVYLAARMTHATLVALLLVAIVVGLGALLYGVDLPTRTLPAFLATLIVGAATFCALGLAVTAIIPNADASPAIVNASILPLLFISDVFIPMDSAPQWITTVANVFPVRHFSAALFTSFNPFESGSGFRFTDLAVMGAWGVAGLVLASRFFRWEPGR